MKTPGKLEIKPLLGIDERIPAPSNSTILLENWTYDAHTKTWNNFLGFEEYFHKTNRPYESAVGQIYDNSTVDSIYVYQRHNSSQQWVLFEQDGKLKYLIPSAGQAANQVAQTLETERHVPGIQEAHTNYTPYGRYVIITNGIDGPLKYRGGDRIYPLGWDRRPGTPDVITPDNFDNDVKPLNYVEATSNFELGQDELEGGGIFKSQFFEGVGFTTGSDGNNEYRYKVSFVNEAGSESPLSEPTQKIVWETLDIDKGTNTYANRACPVMQIPVGPTGTIARRLYRTNNGGSTFNFLDTITNNTDEIYVDFREDSQLGAQAPNDSDSVIFPALGGRFTATFKNCLFIDGGIADGSRLYFSQPNQPDTFKDSNFFDVGTREGGDITGFEVYYNSLLVFREQAIDLIRGDAINGFELVPFVSGIGTKSHHAIVNVPTIGIMFFGQDGIYSISGGLDGGSNLNIQKISDPIQQYIERVSLDGLPSVISIYSSQWREVHFYAPLDDGNQLTHGIIYHLDSGTFSIRNNRDFGINCITTDRDANCIFGRYKDPEDANQIMRGIFVLSKNRRYGTIQEGSGEGATFPDQPAGVSTIRTQWLDFGQPFVKKQIKYVYLYVLTTGNQAPQVGFYKDRDWGEEYDAPGKIMQRADHFFQKVYEPVDPDLEDSQALWGTAKWQDKLLTEIRYPVEMNGAASTFAMEIIADEAMIIMGYAVEYTAKGTETIKGRGSR